MTPTPRCSACGADSHTRQEHVDVLASECADVILGNEAIALDVARAVLRAVATRLKEGVCGECGKAFERNRPKHFYCADACACRARDRAAWHRRKARVAGNVVPLRAAGGER